jgi:hypothetical protein
MVGAGILQCRSIGGYLFTYLKQLYSRICHLWRRFQLERRDTRKHI